MAVTAVIAGCTQEKFNIKGTIADADGKTLYLENLSLDGPVAIDSAKLDATGAFSFKGEAPEAPEFYRLRIEQRIISLCIDSTETIAIEASLNTIPQEYTVSGSDESAVIRELTLKQIDLQRRLTAIRKDYTLSNAVAADSMNAVVNAYKHDIAVNYIYKAPMKGYAYFALFQAIGNMLIFNPQESSDDVKLIAAVATSWDTYYPGSLRGENLHNIAIESMKNLRIVENKRNAQIDPSVISTANIIDIALRDNKGYTRRLTDLAGKVVLLDFHVFAADNSPARIMQLRELYNKYHAAGFEIYQVSLDSDEHFWKQQTEALPWTSVRDPDGVVSQYLTSYNIQALPTFFLVDKSNTLWKRDTQTDDIDAEIQYLLKQPAN